VIEEFLKGIFSLQDGAFFHSLSCLWETDLIFVKIFARDISLEKEVPVEFLKLFWYLVEVCALRVLMFLLFGFFCGRR